MVSGAVSLHSHWHLYGYWILFWTGGLGLLSFFPKGIWELHRSLCLLEKSIGLVITFLLLTLLYFFVVVPLGFLAKSLGKVFLTKGPDPKISSYWVVRKQKAIEPFRHEKPY